MPLRPTLRDIAKETGFSTSTVSAALNNDPRVKAETKAKIRAAADRIGYIPDPALMALSAYRWDNQRNSEGMTIAYLWDHQTDQSDPQRHEVLRAAMKKRTEALGYRLYLHRLKDLGSPESANRILLSRGTSGLLIGPLLDETFIKHFDWSPFSAIAVDLGHVRPPLPVITNNPMTCVRVAWQKILETGRTRIGVVLAPDRRSDFFNEQRAWVTRLQHELPVDVPKIPIHNYQENSDLRKWIEQYKPEAIIGYHEWLCAAICEWGYQVPEDIAFVSLSKQFKAFPDVPHHPEIAGTVSHPDVLGKMGVDQVDLLIRRNIKGEVTTPFSIFVDLDWHSGSTLPETANATPEKVG